MVWYFENGNINMCFLSSKKFMRVLQHSIISTSAGTQHQLCVITESETMIRTNTGVFGPQLHCKSRNRFFGNWRRLLFLSTAGLVEDQISHSSQKTTAPVDTAWATFVTRTYHQRWYERYEHKEVKIIHSLWWLFQEKKIIQTLSFSIHCLI